MTEFRVSSDRLQDLARRLSRDLKPAMKAAALAITAAIQDEIAPYPPASEANSEGRYPYWYRRGSGMVRLTRAGRTTEERNSETLGRKWSIAERGETAAALVNTASYAPFVHSGEVQSWFHSARGWKTDDDAKAAVVESGVASAIIDDQLERFLSADL